MHIGHLTRHITSLVINDGKNEIRNMFKTTVATIVVLATCACTTSQTILLKKSRFQLDEEQQLAVAELKNGLDNPESAIVSGLHAVRLSYNNGSYSEFVCGRSKSKNSLGEFTATTDFIRQFNSTASPSKRWPIAVQDVPVCMFGEADGTTRPPFEISTLQQR